MTSRSAHLPLCLALGFLSAGCKHAEKTGARVYVSNEDSGDVTVVDADRDEVVATIPVGKRPRGIRPSPDGKTLYVALTGSPRPGLAARYGLPAAVDRAADGIAVVDVASGRLARVLPAGTDPEAFDVTPAGDRLFVSNEETSTATAVDVPSGTIAGEVPVGAEPEGVAVRPDGAVVYVACEGANEVAAIDARTLAVIAHIPTGGRPRAVAFDARGDRAYASNELGASVTVIDATTHRPLKDIPIAAEGSRPMGLRISPDSKRLYVTTGRGGGVSVLLLDPGRVERSFDAVGTRPWGVGVTPGGAKLYVADGPSDEVRVIDTSTGKTSKRLRVGASPWGIAVVGRP